MDQWKVGDIGLLGRHPLVPHNLWKVVEVTDAGLKVQWYWDSPRPVGFKGSLHLVAPEELHSAYKVSDGDLAHLGVAR